MGTFKKDIFTSNLFLIDFSFIISYPNTHAPFLDPFFVQSLYPKIWVVKDYILRHIPPLDIRTQTHET